MEAAHCPRGEYTDQNLHVICMMWSKRFYLFKSVTDGWILRRKYIWIFLLVCMFICVSVLMDVLVPDSLDLYTKVSAMQGICGQSQCISSTSGQFLIFIHQT